MRQKKKIAISGTLLDYFPDDTSLNALILSRSSTRFMSYDQQSLEKLGSFWIEKRIAPYPFFIKDDHLYLSLLTGELVAIDVFSGMEMILFDLGLMVPLGTYDHPDGLIVLCGVPINHNNTINTQICVCRCNWTGQKQFQSQSMEGDFLPLTCDNYIWAIVGDTLYKYSPECALQAMACLKIAPKFAPVLVGDCVAVASDMGTMEIFSRSDLSVCARILVGKNSSPPIAVESNKLYWFANKSLYSVIPSIGDIMQEVEIKSDVISTPLLIDRYLYSSDSVGNLIQVNLDNNKITRLRLDNKPLWKPIFKDGFIFVASKEFIFQVEV